MKTNKLWDLIKSMSAVERRYFKRDYLRQNTLTQAPLYLKVFELVQQQSEYDEKEILKNLAPELNTKNVSYTKNYLYNIICDALLKHQNNNNREAYIYRQLSLIRLFIAKGLYNQALQIWDKAIVEARKFELIPLILLLKDEYRKLHLYHNPKVTLPSLEQVYNNTILYAHQFNELVQLQELHFNALILRRKTHFKLGDKDKLKVQKMLQSPVLQQQPEGNSFFIQHYFYMTKATLLFLSNDSLAYQYALSNIMLWQNKEEFIALNSNDYNEVLFIFYYCAVLANDLSKLEAVILHPINNLLITEANINYYEVIKHLALNRLYNRTAAYNKANNIVKSIKQNEQQWSIEVNIELMRTLYISAGITDFVLNNFDDAFYLCKKALLLFNDQARQEQYSFAYLFLLLICFEKKETYLFEIQHNSSFNYFYRNKKPLVFEKHILNCITKAFYCKNKKDKLEIFQLLLDKLKANQKDIIQQQVFNMFNFIGWLESKIAQISYKDWVIKQQNLR